MPLENRNNGNAVFIPTSGGNFARFNALSGRPMPAGPQDSHGLFDAGGGRIGYGELPAGMANDAAPTFQPAPPSRPTSAAGTGAGMTLGASQLKAARDLHDFAKSRLSPEDHGLFSNLLLQYLHRCAGGEADAQGEGDDQNAGGGPPAFPGGPSPGGVIGADPHERPHMAADSAQALRARQEFERDFPEAAKISIDTMGIQAEPTRKRRRDVALALDAASAGRQPEETNADLRDAIAGAARIGRAY